MQNNKSIGLEILYLLCILLAVASAGFAVGKHSKHKEPTQAPINYTTSINNLSASVDSLAERQRMLERSILSLASKIPLIPGAIYVPRNQSQDIGAGRRD